MLLAVSLGVVLQSVDQSFNIVAHRLIGEDEMKVDIREMRTLGLHREEERAAADERLIVACEALR
jgi:hypothetical protein